MGMKKMREEQTERNAKKHLMMVIVVIGLLAFGSRADDMLGSSCQSVPNASLRGTVAMAGSTSMESLANGLAEGFMNRYPQVMVTAEFTGSSAGIEAVLSGSVDIGNSSRQLRPSEKAAGAVEYVVALDGIVMITDVGNPVGNLTKEQLSAIYQGKIRNWCEVGGRDMAIVVVGREAGSGTREAFEEYLEMEDQCDYANELNSTGAVMARVSSTPGAIGYVSWDVLDNTVEVLAIDSVRPTKEAIRTGRYGLSRPYVMVTRGGMEEQSEAVREFFRYLESGEGEMLLENIGVILIAPEEDKGDYHG